MADELAARVVAAGRRCSPARSVLAEWARRGTPRQVEYLAGHLEAERASREASKRANLLRRCALPQAKTFDGHEWGRIEWPDGFGRDDLLSLSFPGGREDLVPVGDVGTGKTVFDSVLFAGCSNRVDKTQAGFPEMTFYYKNGVKVSRGVDPTVEGYDQDAYFKEYELQREIESVCRSGSLAVAGDLTRNPNHEEMRRNAVQMRRTIRKRVELWDGSPSDARDLFGETGSARVDGDLAEALTYLPKSWVEKLARSGMRVVSVDETSTGRSQFAGGKTVEIIEGDSNELTIVHELMHSMDHLDSDFRARDEEFFRERTTGTQEKPLRQLMNDNRCSINEYAHEVDDAYFYYAYKDYRGSANKTSSMGIQCLYDIPVGLRERDPKLFAFAIRQLFEGGETMRMRRLYSGTIVFEVPYEGKWYAIDSLSACPEMYEGSGIPQAVVDRAISALERAYDRLTCAPADSEIRSIGENALKEEFGDARFVSDTYPYGTVIG